MNSICFLTNYNLYESKHYFTKHLAAALEKIGIETLVLEIEQGMLSEEIIHQIIAFSPDLLASFNSNLPIEEGRYYWDYLSIPHLSILVDPSFYSTGLIRSPYSLISCVDRSDCKAIASTGFQKVFFFPHAVEQELFVEEEQERCYDVVFLGSCYDYEGLRAMWQKELSSPFCGMLEQACELVLSNDQRSLAEALVQSWSSTGLDLKNVDFNRLYYYLDCYTRGKDRVELIRSITDVPVHVFGEVPPDSLVRVHGWDHYLGKQDNVTLHPSVSFGESMQVLKRSKIVLNSMPFFRDGSHERIFTGFACGCLPVSSESRYLREEFVAGDEVIFYSTADRSSVNESIHGWLKDEKRRQEAVASGSAKVRQGHTWDRRAEQLVSAVSQKF